VSTANYSPTHSRALNLVGRKGAAIVFTRSTATISESTGLSGAPTATTIAGSAVQAKEDPKRYERLSLQLGGKRTLIFTPSTFNEEVKAGDTATWGTVDVTVEGAEHIAPAGEIIASYVIVSP
jgi:hypothetical protein